MFPRLLDAKIRASLKDTRVVAIVGPRQSGKTTLLRQLSSASRTFLTLDNVPTLEAARADPVRFLNNLDFVALDEAQRAPELILAIKESVDADPRPGRFLISGSADVLTLPTVADSLAGRIEAHTLLPLARAEIAETKRSFIELLFSLRAPKHAPDLDEDELIEHVLAGGYPEARVRKTASRRTQWYRSYVETIVQRDMRDVSGVADLRAMPRLLRALAESAAQLVNYSELGGQLGMNHNTTSKYVAALELVYLVRTVEPYFQSTLKRLVKTPKVHFFDTGLLAALRGDTVKTLAGDRKRLGPLLESFVFGELSKLAAASDDGVRISHYRDRDGNEIDFILEDDSGRVGAIEVKAAATVRAEDFATMKRFVDSNAERWASGFVLYSGDKILPFGERMFAVPFSILWA